MTRSAEPGGCWLCGAMIAESASGEAHARLQVLETVRTHRVSESMLFQQYSSHGAANTDKIIRDSPRIVLQIYHS